MDSAAGPTTPTSGAEDWYRFVFGSVGKACICKEGARWSRNVIVQCLLRGRGIPVQLLASPNEPTILFAKTKKNILCIPPAMDSPIASDPDFGWGSSGSEHCTWSLNVLITLRVGIMAGVQRSARSTIPPSILICVWESSKGMYMGGTARVRALLVGWGGW